MGPAPLVAPLELQVGAGRDGTGQGLDERWRGVLERLSRGVGELEDVDEAPVDDVLGSQPGQGGETFVPGDHGAAGVQ